VTVRGYSPSRPLAANAAAWLLVWASGWAAAPPVLAQAPSTSTSSPAPAPAASAPADYAQRYAQSCAACHGADGRGAARLAPALAGQPSFYAITQLFLFRAGRRSNEAMSAVAKGFSDNDLRGFSEFIGKLPAVANAPPSEPLDATRLSQGQALAQRHLCASCHGADFTGGTQVPRLAGQQQDYLSRALQEFRAGSRVGYTSAMNEALSGLQPDELDTLAYYLARHAGVATP
jgi:cytochrome c553